MSPLATVEPDEAPPARAPSFTTMTQAQSVVCDLVRYLAAFAVVIHHSADFEYDRWYGPFRNSYLTNLGSLGVAVFFLLSGFLITYTVARKSEAGRYTLGEYLVERAVRIYIAFIPAIVFAFFVVQALIALQADIPPSPSRRHFLLTVVMMSGVQPVLGHLQTYSLITQAWTLNYEFFFYFVFGALCVAGTGLSPAADLARRVFVVGLFASLALRLEHVQMMGVNWVLGVVIALLFQLTAGGTAPGTWRWLTGAAVIGGLAWARLSGFPVPPPGNDVPYLGMVILGCLFFIALVGSRRLKSFPATRAIQLFAGFSYSMYLVHYAVMYLTRIVLMRNHLYDPRIEDGRKLAAYVVLVVASHVVAYGLYLGAEKHTNRVRKAVLVALRLKTA